MITHNHHTYKVFDTHTHAFPDAIAQAAVEGLTKRAGIPHYHDGTYSGLTAYEARADKFLLLPIATKPQQAHSVNTWAARHVGGKMLSFGSVHPQSAQFIDELDEVVALGLRGIKLHPEYQQFFVDDERHFPLYRAIFERGLILCFHTGVDLGYPPPLHGSARRMARVCDAFPNRRIIAAHMGGYLEYEDSWNYLAGRENLWMDTAYVTLEMPPEQLKLLARRHGTERVLFATDAPWTALDDSLGTILRAGFTHEELQNILYDNAARLLGKGRA